MKALFFHPDVAASALTTLPLAFLHLATALKGSGHSLELVDGRLAREPVEAARRALDGKGALLITAMPGSQIASAVAVCRMTRREYPGVKIIWGGPHASLNPESTVSSPYADVVVVGRGESVLARLLAALAGGLPFDDLPGVFWKTGSEVRGGLDHGGRRQSLAAPDLALLSEIEPYICQTRRSRRMIDYISSLGCPNRCAFCCEPAIWHSVWQAMPAEELVAAVAQMRNRYGADGVLLQDANFTANRLRLRRYCEELLRLNLKMNWIATTCVVDAMEFHQNGTLELMREAGCEMLFIGAETGDQGTMSAYHKNIDVNATLTVADLLWRQYQILPHFSYVISYPVESMDAVRRTLHLHEEVCRIVGSPTGEMGYYNPVSGTAFLELNAQHFRVPMQLEDWSAFDFMSRKLYRESSAELEALLLRHHVKIRRLFPSVPVHETFDIWQGKQSTTAARNAIGRARGEERA